MKNKAYILIKPLITEKSISNTEKGYYTFLVLKNAGKKEIKKAVEEQFKVNVIEVKTITLKGKTKKTGKRRMTVTSSPKKKAIVKLAQGQKIDAFEVRGK